MSRVLVVDDDQAQVELLKAYLEDVVDEVSCVTDSRRVESEFTTFEPDIVVLNLHMPPPDGFEILRRLRGAHESLGFASWS